MVRPMHPLLQLQRWAPGWLLALHTWVPQVSLSLSVPRSRGPPSLLRRAPSIKAYLLFALHFSWTAGHQSTSQICNIGQSNSPLALLCQTIVCCSLPAQQVKHFPQ